MINQHETQGSKPQQGKVILPAYSDHMPGRAPNNTHILPEQLVRPATTPPPKDPLARLGYFWRKDPAYKVLILAVGVVLIAGLLFVSLVSSAMSSNPNFFALNSTFSQVPPTAIAPTGTVDARPTFPAPAGGQGSSSSSQPPAQGTPALQPTVNVTPTDQPTQGGPLTLQIVNIPRHVTNNSVVQVGVNASEANVSVTLSIFYNVPPNRGFAGPSLTDGSGNATIPWSVAIFRFGGGARALVVATARDQNGQQAQSQPVTVAISTFGG
jgi:hypothetical protein